jgi:two-component system chemotaxis response regulator CheB
VATRLVVVGGSAGSLDPLRTLAAGLPADFAAAVLVVMHVSSNGRSALAEILDRAGPLPARAARHGQPIEPGQILVGPPDRHLVVHDDVVHLSRGPRENQHRPAIDALFNSAARWHGPDVVGVVLSGVLDDGAVGAMAIAAQDGIVLVQDPEEAQCPGMPTAALRAVRRARPVPSGEIAKLLTTIIDGLAPDEPPTARDEFLEWEASNVDTAPASSRGDTPGAPAAIGCPDCHGGMFEVTDNGNLHYVCHVGHSWSPETLLTTQREVTESALYNAASKLLEEAAVLRRLAELASTGDAADSERAAEHLREAERAEQRAARIQNMVRDDT